jgi:hypothetical protein
MIWELGKAWGGTLMFERRMVDLDYMYLWKPFTRIKGKTDRDDSFYNASDNNAHVAGTHMWLQ